MLRGSHRRLIASNQRVGCPQLGDRNVEHCVSCPYLTALDLDAPDPWISCRVPDASSPLDLFSLYGKE